MKRLDNGIQFSDPNVYDTTGLILAGGRSSRLGSSDKGLAKYKGRTLIEHQLSVLTSQTPSILISANRNIDTYERFGFEVLTDDNDSFMGPLQGVLQGLRSCQTPWMYVLPIDVPDLPATTLTNAIEKIKQTPEHQNKTIHYFSSVQREHYLCMLIHKTEQVYLSDFVNRGGNRVKSFHEARGSVSLNLEISEKHFKNLNEVRDFN